MTSSEIISSVPNSFEKAIGSGDVLFFPSTIVKQIDSDVEFEIRLCPALQKKPRLPQPNLDVNPSIDVGTATPENETQSFDPFAPPYNPNLHVGDVQDNNEEEYVVLLNKYALIRQHFLLITKVFRSQSSPLMPCDLVQSYLLLVAAKKARNNIFAFYNCGDNSGASQPHKHIQFIPTEDEGPPIEQLARSVNLETPDKPFSLTKLAYANHVFRFPANISSYTLDKLEAVLSTAFLALLDLCISTIRHDSNYPTGKPSYNVLITLEHMHIIPRRKETHILTETSEALSINALAFAGMLAVKSDKELNAVKSEGIGKILRSVALESVHDLQIAGTTAEAGE